jgi:hypothetical protein
MKTPPIVSPEAWEAARVELLVKENGREGLSIRRPERQGEPARPVRGPPPALRSFRGPLGLKAHPYSLGDMLN